MLARAGPLPTGAGWRLSLLKAAVDYLAEGGPVVINEDGTIRVDFRITDLPRSFAEGLSWLGQQPSYRLYPTFWQTFLWGWGGMLVHDRLSDDYAGLEMQTGVPAAEIPTALSAFDALFPTGGWLKPVGRTSYSVVSMMPHPFQGIGAWQRLLRAGAQDYPALGLTGQYTASDLAARHNMFVRVVNEDFDF
jgi:hypothetical protein